MRSLVRRIFQQIAGNDTPPTQATQTGKTEVRMQPPAAVPTCTRGCTSSDSKRETIVKIRNLTTSFRGDAGPLRAVDGVSLDLHPGKTLALVGESGCGKSLTALSIMRLVPADTATIETGEIILDGTNLLTLSPDEMQKVRGNRISMIFQEPMTAMNPVHTVGAQIMEVLQIHKQCSKKQARKETIEWLHRVGIADASQRVDDYPFQFSGGMLQRALIAMALACEPEVLIADEPTTALDATIQAQILTLMGEMQHSLGTSILLISHDLGIVREIANEVAIMYAGRIVEYGAGDQVLTNPQHPYTQGLLASLPALNDDRSRPLATIAGQVPALNHVPSGCRFHPRCPHTEEVCRGQPPTLQPTAQGQRAACHLLE